MLDGALLCSSDTAAGRRRPSKILVYPPCVLAIPDMVLFFSCACAPHVQDDTSLETLDQLQENPGTDPVEKVIDSAAVVPSPEGAQEGRKASPTLNGSDDPPRESKPRALEKADVSPVPDSKPAVSLLGGSILEENSRTGQTISTGASTRNCDGVALGSSAFRRLGATSPRRSWNNVRHFTLLC